MRVAVTLLGASFGLCAQCVMCNRTAAAQNAARAGVLNTGIVILLIPPVLILAGLTFFAWKKMR